MDVPPGTAPSGQAVALEDDVGLDALSQPGNLSGSDVFQECLNGNPRFSAPANDDTRFIPSSKLAPRRADCREAMLLCLWAEILLEEQSS